MMLIDVRGIPGQGTGTLRGSNNDNDNDNAIGMVVMEGI